MKRYIIYFLIFIFSFVLTGCWDYNEINQKDIVIGFAVDNIKKNNNYMLTSEIIGTQPKKKGQQLKSLVFQSKGESIFDAIRKFVELGQNVFYWPHAKVIIIGKSFAQSGIQPIIDFAMRDAEFRSNIYILVSDENSAADIFTQQLSDVPIVSLMLEQTLYSEQKVGTFKNVHLWEFVDKLSTKGYSPTVPLVYLESQNNKIIPRINGTAVFKEDKMVGKLTGEETKYYLFIINEIKNQPLKLKYKKDNKVMDISLEIYKNETKLKPIKNGDDLIMQINVNTKAGFAETNSTTNVFEQEEIKKIESFEENEIKKNIQKLVKKVQCKYNSDIFGFGDTIKNDMTKEWKQIEKNWDNKFCHLNIKVKVKFTIEKTGVLSKPVKIGGR